MTLTYSTPLRLAPVLVLGLLAACGGSSSNTPAPTPAATVYAKTLSYTNPPVNGYSFQVEPASNNTAHLVLDLVGPTGMAIQGVAFFLTTDTSKASWGSPGGPVAYATAGPALNMTQGTLPAAQLFAAKRDTPGANLQVGIFQKTGTSTLGASPIVSVQLDLAPNVVAGTNLTLGVTSGKSAVYLDASGTLKPMNGAAPGAITVVSIIAQ